MYRLTKNNRAGKRLGTWLHADVTLFWFRSCMYKIIQLIGLEGRIDSFSRNHKWLTAQSDEQSFYFWENARVCRYYRFITRSVHLAWCNAQRPPPSQQLLKTSWLPAGGWTWDCCAQGTYRSEWSWTGCFQAGKNDLRILEKTSRTLPLKSREKTQQCHFYSILVFVVVKTKQLKYALSTTL